MGKYTLIAELGRGGMGIVYLAVTQGPGGFSKLLVVKELRPELAGEAAFLPMFLDEARLAARLNHPNVVQTYEVGDEGGRYFMAMEYLEGQTLQRTLSTSRHRGLALPRPVVLRVLSEALLGLHYAHELCGFDGEPLGVVHRDVSPHNVFLTYDGQIKLVDFGIAKALDSSHETAVGTLKGKVGYMAPEQVTRPSSTDRRADVFAAGVLLWEALVGHKFWDGVPVNEVLLRLTSGALPPGPAAVAPNVPGELDRICARALAADRRERYPTALAFRDALDDYVRSTGESASAHEVGRFVADAFAAERQTNRSIVDHEMKRLTSGAPRAQLASLTASPHEQTPFSSPGHAFAPLSSAPPPFGSAPPPPGSTPPPPGVLSHHSALAFASQPSATPASSKSPGPTRRTIGLAVGVIVASASLTAVATVVSRGASRGARASQVAAAVASEQPDAQLADEAPEAKPPAPVLALNVRVSPASARVLLDDEELPPNARASVRPRDGRPHRLYAEAEGYAPRSEIILFDEANLVVNLVLDKRPAQAPGPPASRHRAPAVAASSPRPAAPPRPAASSAGDVTATPQGGKPPKRAIDPWNPYGG